MTVENRPEAETGRTVSWDPEEVTVHEVLRREQGARAVLERFGLDTCCGGELPVAVAAEHHDVDLDLLLDALAVAGGEEAGS